MSATTTGSSVLNDYRNCVVVTEFDGTDSSSVERLLEFAASLLPLRVVAVAGRILPAQHDSLRAAPERMVNVSVFELELTLGKGASLRAALAQTVEPYIAFVMLDGELPAIVVTEALNELIGEEGVDGIVWNRFAAQGNRGLPVVRRLKSGVCNAVARTLFGLQIIDVHSPLKVFRRESLVSVFDHLRLYNHGFDTDLLYNAKRIGLRIVERPLFAVAFSGRRAHFIRDAFNAALAIVALRLFHSPLRSLPLVDYFGARYALPAKRAYSIAIFCWRDPFSPKAGGGEVYLHEQAKCWVRQGCSVTWLSERFNGSNADEWLDGIRFARRGRGLLVFVAAALWYIFESKRNYDFIIDVMNGIPFFTPLYSSKPKICLMYHIHSHHFRDELPKGVAQLAIAVETKIAPFVYQRTRFMTISESTKREMRALHITKMPIVTVQSGVAADLVPGEKAHVPTVLYVGRIRRYKRLAKLIVAFGEVKREVVDARLIIAGTGDGLQELQELVAELELRDVDFLGRVNEGTKIRLMQEAWVFGMPSRLEGWGIVVIEAAACATPSVAYDVNGLRDCIVDGETGLLSTDDESFVRNLRRLLTDNDLRSRLSANAHRWSARFSWDRTAQRTLTKVRLSQPWRAVFEPINGTSWALRRRTDREARNPIEISRSSLVPAAAEQESRTD